jgi:predicted MFS family arabinose efflux permease
MSSAGVGAVIGALQFAARTHYKGLARWIAATSATCAVCLIVFSQAKTLVLCIAVLFVVGFAATSQMAATNTLIQNRVPDELRSRVMAVYATMFMGVQPIGSLIAGGVAKRIGAPYALAVFGTLMLLGSLVFIFRVMRLGETQTATAD